MIEIRLLTEITQLQNVWIEIDNILAKVKPFDMKFNWTALNDKAKSLLFEAKKNCHEFERRQETE